MPIGPYEQQSFGKRDDVLVFRTPSLREPVNVTGPLMAKLYAATDVPCTQWVVQLLDEYPDGTCYNLIEGNTIAHVRDPGEVQEYILDIRATSNVFLVGHRIRIHVMSSLFPMWERNLNTGTRTARSEDIKPAHNRIYHDQDHPSFIMLPVMGSS
jgi:putative CocE/NonD family hydrolase